MKNVLQASEDIGQPTGLRVRKHQRNAEGLGLYPFRLLMSAVQKDEIEALIEQITMGNQTAFSRLYDATSENLFRYACVC